MSALPAAHASRTQIVLQDLLDRIDLLPLLSGARFNDTRLQEKLTADQIEALVITQRQLTERYQELIRRRDELILQSFDHESDTDASDDEHDDDGVANNNIEQTDSADISELSNLLSGMVLASELDGVVLRGHLGAMTAVQAEIDKTGSQLRDTSLQLTNILQGASAAAAKVIAGKIYNERESLISDLRIAQHQLTDTGTVGHLIDKVGTHFEQRRALAAARLKQAETSAKLRNLTTTHERAQEMQNTEINKRRTRAAELTAAVRILRESVADRVTTEAAEVHARANTLRRTREIELNRLLAEQNRLERACALENTTTSQTGDFFRRVIENRSTQSAQWRERAERELGAKNAELQTLARLRQNTGKDLEALRQRWRMEQADRAAADQAAAEARQREKEEKESITKRENATLAIQRWFRYWNAKRKASKAATAGKGKKKKGKGKAKSSAKKGKKK